jgi:hypothetical protein
MVRVLMSLLPNPILTRDSIVNVIMFLMPMSAFNQNLAEDPSVNRLVCPITPLAQSSVIDVCSQEDSFIIWKKICGSKLLQTVQFILLLNKFDVLDKKLKAGIQFQKHVKSYKDQPNDTKDVAKCVFLINSRRVIIGLTDVAMIAHRFNDEVLVVACQIFATTKAAT